MRRSHFDAFRPVCPICAASGVQATLVVGWVLEEVAGEIIAGVLHCPSQACAHEFPIVDGLPVIVADLGGLLTRQAAALLLRRDFPPALESLVGDALGPDSWFDALRQTASTYGWDAFGELDPDERLLQGGPMPGAARRCLARLCDLAGEPAAGRVLDLGCGAGRTSFALAERHGGALVLGVDVNLGLLRLARGALAGLVDYPRRRIGLVYDRRRFAVCLPGSERVDFWACDASALPFTDGSADLTAAVNLLDCMADPAGLLSELARLLAPGGRLLLSTPYDWTTRATQPAQWIGGHSQRAAHGGSGEDFLRSLLAEGAHRRSVAGLDLLAEDTNFPWQTRLHDRSTVAYAAHLLALRRN